MENFNRKDHWKKIYATKALMAVSWYQPVPQTSLDLLEQCGIQKNGKIIDVGGGDSFLVDHLLEQGYTDITVLDISAAALERTRLRLGDKALHVKWIVADASAFIPTEQYDFWHDRAAFHFLTNEADINSYVTAAGKGIKPGGMLAIGTFSEDGPKKCSGVEIKQYSGTSMAHRLIADFEKIKCITVDHKTPFDTIQNFIFCSFRRK